MQYILQHVHTNTSKYFAPYIVVLTLTSDEVVWKIASVFMAVTAVGSGAKVTENSSVSSIKWHCIHVKNYNIR